MCKRLGEKHLCFIATGEYLFVSDLVSKTCFISLVNWSLQGTMHRVFSIAVTCVIKNLPNFSSSLRFHSNLAIPSNISDQKMIFKLVSLKVIKQGIKSGCDKIALLYTYMAMLCREWKLPNCRIRLAKIDIKLI